jgi:ABC-2 type transport system permease protein
MIRKETLQIRREPINFVIVLVMPFIQLLILGAAITLDVKHVPVVVWDQDHSQLSRRMLQSLQVNPFVDLKAISTSYGEMEALLCQGQVKAALVIPYGLQRQLVRRGSIHVPIYIDGSEAMSARIGLGYIMGILSQQLVPDRPDPAIVRYLFNPNLESKRQILPGIVGILLLMVTLFMTAINIVKEKEQGTLEQLRVTPLAGMEVMAGKIIPYGVLGLILMQVGMLFTGLFWGVWPAGGWLTLTLMSSCFMLASLGVGAFISTAARNQLQAMLMAWIFSIFGILLSGFFVPIENMPPVVQFITLLNPLRYFITILQSVYLTGAGVSDLWPELGILTLFGIGMLGLAARRFTRREN